VFPFSKYDDYFYQQLEETMFMFLRNMNPTVLELIEHHVKSPLNAPETIERQNNPEIQAIYEKLKRTDVMNTFPIDQKLINYILVKRWRKKVLEANLNEVFSLPDPATTFTRVEVLQRYEAGYMGTRDDVRRIPLQHFDNTPYGDIWQKINQYFDNYMKLQRDYYSMTPFRKNVVREVIDIVKWLEKEMRDNPFNADDNKSIQLYSFALSWNHAVQDTNFFVEETPIPQLCKLNTEYMRRLYWADLFNDKTEFEFRKGKTVTFTDMMKKKL
jgi:hypothetical protein